MTTIAATLDCVALGDPVTAGPLLLFPLFDPRRAERRYMCGADAIEAGVLAIREHTEPIVHELVVHNTGHLPVLLIEGELLLGLRQDRAVNVSLLCPVEMTIPVPVSCVEAGRWGDQRPLSAARSQAPLSLRAGVIGSVTRSVEADGSRRSDQHAVWSEVDLVGDRTSAASATHALNELAEQSRCSPERNPGPRPRSGQSGVAVVLDGRVRAVDLFDSPETLNAHWDALVDAYRMDQQPNVPSDIARPAEDAVLTALTEIARAEVTTNRGVGLGVEHHMRRLGLVGQALEWDGTIVHLSAVFS